jgi:hypothetical protein
MPRHQPTNGIALTATDSRPRHELGHENNVVLRRDFHSPGPLSPEVHGQEPGCLNGLPDTGGSSLAAVGQDRA